MYSTRKHMDGFGVGAMILLCAVWGLHQVAIKAAAPDIAPITQIALRSGLSAVLVAIVIGCGGEGFSLRDGTLRAGILVGIIFAAEFLFIAEGLRYTSASHMAVFLYTAPIFTALALHRLLPAERLSPHQWGGIAIAFGGIVLAFAGGLLHTGIDPRIMWGDLLGVLAGAAWGATTVAIRCSRLADAAPTKTLLYQLVAAFILLLVYAVVTGQTSRIIMSRIAWESLLFQGVVITFASYVAWFSLLRKYLASRLSVFLFLSPLYGVFFGVIILHEKIDAYFALGAVLVLAGLVLVNRRQVLRRPAC